MATTAKKAETIAQQAAGAAQPDTQPAEPAKQVPEAPTYTADEFARSAESVFGKGTSPDIVRAAFRVAGITSATAEEAKKLVAKFAGKEVTA